MTVVVVGSINRDITVLTDRFPEPGETLLGRSVTYGLGGKGANQAAAAARAGAEVAFLGAVGDDGPGQELRATLEEFGIDTALLNTAPGTSTGTAHITVNANGENHIIVVPGANATTTAQAVADARDRLGAARVLVCQGEVPSETVNAVVELGRATGADVVLNLAPVIPAGPFDGLAVLVVNESEAGLMLDTAPPEGIDEALEAARLLRMRGIRRVVITLGSQGAVYAGADEDGHVPAPRPRAVVDTTGAGDAAVGVLAAGLAQNLPFERCVQAAVRAGSLSVERPGASASYPRFKLD